MRDYVLAERPRALLTLRELCHAFDLHADQVVELVEFGVIEPARGRGPSEWRFSAGTLLRVRRALRLQHDLQLNHAGLALALDLLEEVQALRTRLRVIDPGG